MNCTAFALFTLTAQHLALCKNNGVVPVQRKNEFKERVKLLSTQKSRAVFDENVLYIKHEFPNCIKWINWYLHLDRGKLIFPAMVTCKVLFDQSVALIIKDYLSKAGIDSNNYSGHSLRSGFATSAAEAGAEERSIMAMTGHKSTEMVRRYIKEANLFKNNALNKIKF